MVELVHVFTLFLYSWHCVHVHEHVVIRLVLMYTSYNCAMLMSTEYKELYREYNFYCR